MASRVRTNNYDYDTREWEMSRREYEVLREIRGEKETGDYYTRQEITAITLYLDTDNGLVVHDVAAYEAWLDRVVLR